MLLGGQHNLARPGLPLAFMVQHAFLGPVAMADPHADIPDALANNSDWLAVLLQKLVIRATLEVVQSGKRTTANRVPHREE